MNERDRKRKLPVVKGRTIKMPRHQDPLPYLVGAEEPGYWRPATRADCADVPRPCPYLSCQYNLYLDVTPTGNIHLNFPAIEPDEMQESCALDVAAEGGASLDRVAECTGVTRERIRQLENHAQNRIKMLYPRFKENLR